MIKNQQFACALHILTLLTMNKKPVSAKVLAGSAGVHPSTVRKLIRTLEQAGLVTSTQDGVGGVPLQRDPSQISLKEVYVALRKTSLFETVPHLACPVGKDIQQVLVNFFDESERALLESLGAMTMESIHGQVAN